MYRYALYVGVTAIYMNTVATVGHLFSCGVTVGCDLIHLFHALRFSLGHFSVGYWADTGGTTTHQHPSIFIPVAPLLRALHCSLGANNRGAASSGSHLSKQLS